MVIMDMQKLCDEHPEEYVRFIFDLFEIQDHAEEVMKKNRTIKPDLKWSEDDYVLNYYQHCPAFRELMKRSDPEAIAYLWRIKDFKIKLNAKVMSEAPTYNTCLSCLRNNDEPACKRRSYK